MTPGGSKNAPILIAGGGIGGLSAAIALAERGLHVLVLEAEPEFAEIGAGIQIGPNGSRILRAWGLGDALARQAARPERILIRDGRKGRRLAAIPLGDQAEARYGAPYYVAERRVLHRILLDKALTKAEVEILSGFRIASFSWLRTGIAVMSASGREAHGQALIGADGVHSQLRTLLFGRPPAYSGRNAWRAIAPLDAADEPSHAAVNLWFGPNAHLVHYACGPDGPLNAVAFTGGPPASPGWGARGDRNALTSAFAEWAEAPRSLLSRFDHWAIWPLLRLPPLKRWGEERVTLLGDAAHPLMPFLASGAVMAIEDAAVLAAELARSPRDIEAAFRRYETRRMPRVSRVQKASERMGEIYQMTGAMRLARNLTLGALPTSLLVSRNDWLYGYCVEA